MKMAKTLVRTKGASGTTLASVLFERTSPDRKLVVSAYSITSDKAGSVVSVKEFDGQSIDTDAICADGQKVVTVDGLTAPYSQDDVIIAQRPDRTVERMEVDTVQADVSLTMKANLAVALPVGTTLYRVTEAYNIPVGAATITAIGDGPLGYFVSNIKNGPVCLDLDGTSACAFNFLTGFYL